MNVSPMVSTTKPNPIEHIINILNEHPPDAHHDIIMAVVASLSKRIICKMNEIEEELNRQRDLLASIANIETRLNKVEAKNSFS